MKPSRDLFFQRLVETSWRRPLLPEEQRQLHDWLEAHPDCRSHWLEEAALNQYLQQLPDVPVASNFTAQIMAELDRPQPARARSGLWLRWGEWTRRLAPRFVLAALLALLGISAWSEFQLQKRTRLAQSIATVISVADVPSPEILQDFDAIHQLQRVPPVTDEELIAALQ